MRVFAVRMMVDRQAVGFFWVGTIDHLIDMVDQICDPDRCEFLEIKKMGGFGWGVSVGDLGVRKDYGNGEENSEGALHYRMLMRTVEPQGSVEDLMYDGAIDKHWKPLVPESPRCKKILEKAKRSRAPQIQAPPDTVYFIGCDDHIKIGVTSGPVRRRLKSIATAHHKEIMLLAVIENAPGDLEYTLHQRFAAHRVRGEWFRAAPELLAYIEEIKAGNCG